MPIGFLPVFVTAIASETTTVPFIRSARRSDLLAVVDIEQRSFPQPWSIGAFERFLDAPAFLVAVDRDSGQDGAVIGYIVADAVPNHGTPLGHVKDLAVHPDCRRTGIGRQLLERAVCTLRSTGVGSIKLEVRESNDPAKRLYQRTGFVHRRTIPRYYDDGEDALVMLQTWG
ncbi:ribosomal-protein-alanine N-acetyltransferase [Halorhabdus sp. CBA1104]|uniref:ribosomal protein S18-alanine N-acetyltransferase n=1 Tax=unclassified Halorhabdus TaxID=2621901 RepID=UPI0012B3BFF8|nr:MULTISPECIES: ribosomal protein S18-alanine N-acetyltransferase [unclassified Halorhabdus]QGN07607.1 ribosomal-protein-alanine N-acetyltransferase [Halorhabdus sp. CBA1104]